MMNLPGVKVHPRTLSRFSVLPPRAYRQRGWRQDGHFAVSSPKDGFIRPVSYMYLK